MGKNPTTRELAPELYSHLALRFPICCASDEFVFFPQATGLIEDWSYWDDLSNESVEETVNYLRGFQRKIQTVHGSGNNPDLPLLLLLSWFSRTLEEQFTIVRTHATQPTFALSLATVGLIQALQSGKESAWVQRLQGLPVFLDNAFEVLSDVPELYRDLGVEMAGGITQWLRAFEPGPQIERAVEAISDYKDGLSRLSVRTGFRLESEVLERVVEEHTGSGLAVKEVLCELEDEIAVVRQQLGREAGKLGYGCDWEWAYSEIPGDSVPEGGKKGLLNLEIGRLKEHCIRCGFLTRSQSKQDRLKIESLPSSLASIRSADSYNAIPGHPFEGGIFYIFSGGSLGMSSRSIHPVYRMTAAHEAYPGHHLLDLCRWNNPVAVLRPIEYPLFYEGWACFGEDLMLGTGAFDRPYDRLILLRRRLRHAIRGKVDLSLHSGEMGCDGAAAELLKAGFSRNRALDTVRKYALRPAYQICYTIGRRRFQKLFDSYGQRDIPGFVSTVLRNGELLFKDLERVLKNSGEGERESGGGGETTKRTDD